MEDITVRRDETPYLIFACKKCGGFSYVKTVQKTKKCLRCGRTHQVRDILKNSDVVYGMTEAVNTVKRKQNEFATPEFRSGSDFIVATLSIAKPKSKGNALKSKDQEIDYAPKFNEMLCELSRLYNRFPEYMLDIIAEDYKIPSIELISLMRNAKKSGVLIKDGDDDMYYRYKNK